MRRNEIIAAGLFVVSLVLFSTVQIKAQSSIPSPSPSPAPIVRPITPTPAAVTCGSTWTEVFKGTYSSSTPTVAEYQHVPLNLNKQISLDQLRAMLNAGCTFSVAIEKGTNASSGATMFDGFECAAVTMTPYDEGNFECRPSTQVGQGDEAPLAPVSFYGLSNSTKTIQFYYGRGMGVINFTLFAKK